MSLADFGKVCKDFVSDLLSTFPELEKTLDPSLKMVLQAPTEGVLTTLHEYISTTWSPYLFDILGEKVTMFDAECLLLPNVDFKLLWNENITETTKQTIWKYLKLLVIMVVGNMAEKDKLFEGLASEEVRAKLDEATKDIHDFFKEMPIPNSETLHEHINSLLTGKLGQLAKEIADETVGDESNVDKMQDMMKNPSKLMGLVQSVGDKIDSKIKNGELKESELMEEASEMLKKMKEMPGLDQLFKKFAGGGGKMDMAGMQSKLNQNVKAAKTKERLQQKLKERKAGAEAPEPEKKKKKKKKKA